LAGDDHAVDLLAFGGTAPRNAWLLGVSTRRTCSSVVNVTTSIRFLQSLNHFFPAGLGQVMGRIAIPTIIPMVIFSY